MGLVTVQGGLVRGHGTHTHKKAGGGKRGRKRGHSKDAARRMLNRLLILMPAPSVIWPTYPKARGPGGVHRDFVAFARRIQRRIDPDFACIAKIEPQRRLAPELTVIAWNLPRLGKDDLRSIRDAWHAVVGSQARVRVERVRDWQALAFYVSKPWKVTSFHILFSGAKPKKLSPYPCPSTHNLTPTDPNKVILHNAFRNNAKLLYEWRNFSGRTWFTFNAAAIPKAPVEPHFVPEETMRSLRWKANQRRIKQGVPYLVSPGDPFALRGSDAAWGTKKIVESVAKDNALPDVDS